MQLSNATYLPLFPVLGHSSILRASTCLMNLLFRFVTDHDSRVRGFLIQGPSQLFQKLCAEQLGAWCSAGAALVFLIRNCLAISAHLLIVRFARVACHKTTRGANGVKGPVEWLIVLVCEKILFCVTWFLGDDWVGLSLTSAGKMRFNSVDQTLIIGKEVTDARYARSLVQ